MGINAFRRRRGIMSSSVQTKAQTIYNQFTKAPVLEMVQYMVDENVDAQMLHQLKLIDTKMHKNPHVKSYGEKIYDAYERICRILVTYPSLEFKDNELKIQKDKDKRFSEEYFGHKKKVSNEILDGILEVVNISLSNCIESNDIAEKRIQDISNDEKSVTLLSIFIKEACGEDYSSYIKKVSSKS